MSFASLISTTRPAALPSAPSAPPREPSSIVPCSPTALQTRRETLPATTVAVASGTPAEEALARQKAAFVAAVWQAHSEGLPQADAAAQVAALGAFPLLADNGLINSGKKALANYRQWAAKCGRQCGGRAPAVDNWRELLPRYRGSRAYQQPGNPKFWMLLARVYEHPNQLPLKGAYREARRAASLVGMQDLPTYEQARHYYQVHCDQKRVLLARNGEEWFRNHVAGFIDRDAPAVDEVWVGDHHKLDLACRVWDAEKAAWAPERPWLTAWLDWGSMAFVGWQIRALDPNRDSVERSLRIAVARNGNRPPAHLYIDNGQDYKAKGFSRPVADADNERASCIAEALGCKVHFAIPYNARAKVIERCFKEVCERFSKMFASYRGSDPSKRPGEADVVWSDPESLPDLDEVATHFERWLAIAYHAEANNGKACGGKSPAQMRAEAVASRPALEPACVYKAFLRDVGERVIGRGGVVTAIGRQFVNPELWQLQRNARVRVKVDPDNTDLAWIYTLDGREIAPARVKASLPGMIADDAPAQTVEQLRAGMAEQRRQIKDTKRRSAEARGLPAFRKRPEVDVDRLIADLDRDQKRQQASIPAGVVQAPRNGLAQGARDAAAAAAAMDIDAMAGELDEILRANSADRLHGQTTLDLDNNRLDDDLAAIEAEAREAAGKNWDDVPF